MKINNGMLATTEGNKAFHHFLKILMPYKIELALTASLKKVLRAIIVENSSALSTPIFISLRLLKLQDYFLDKSADICL